MKKTDTRKGLGCLVLFALPFAGVGGFAGYRITTGLWEWFAMRAWVEVPADVVEARLETHDGSDTTTYEVEAEYVYRYEGREYRGTRVGIHRGSDNVTEFHQDAYRELSRYRSSRSPFRCYVDPSSPSNSVLYRDMRWGILGFYAIFLIAFGGAGGGLIVAGIYGSRRLERENALRDLSPGSPWLHKDEWRTGKVPSVSRRTLVTSAVFAVLWNAISAPLLFLVPRELARGNAAALIGLLFPLVGAGLLLWFARSLVQLWKFGESAFEMTSPSGIIGGRLDGVVRTAKPLVRVREVEVRLSAVGRARSRSGDGGGMEETILWQQTSLVTPGRSYGRGTTPIPVSFEIPEGLPQFDDSDPDHQIVWRLDVRADVPGVDYEARFEVPVFPPASGATPSPSAKRESPPVDLDARLKKAGVLVELLADGKRFVFPRARNTGSALGFTAFFLVWTAIVVVLFYSEAPRLFPWVFGAFDALFLLVFLDLWLYSSALEVRPGELRFRGGLLGRGRERRWSASEVERIEAKRGEQSGNRLFYKIDVFGRDRRGKTVARRIPDLETAGALAREIEEGMSV